MQVLPRLSRRVLQRQCGHSRIPRTRRSLGKGPMDPSPKQRTSLPRRVPPVFPRVEARPRVRGLAGCRGCWCPKAFERSHGIESTQAGYHKLFVSSRVCTLPHQSTRVTHFVIIGDTDHPLEDSCKLPQAYAVQVLQVLEVTEAIRAVKTISKSQMKNIERFKQDQRCICGHMRACKSPTVDLDQSL